MIADFAALVPVRVALMALAGRPYCQLAGRWLYCQLVWRIYGRGGADDVVAIINAMKLPMLRRPAKSELQAPREVEHEAGRLAGRAKLNQGPDLAATSEYQAWRA